MEGKENLYFPPHYVDSEKKVVVVFTKYELVFAFQNRFLELYPEFAIYVVWSKRLMDEIIFLLDHDLDPFVGTNALSDMAIAHIQKYHNPILTHFPIELDGKIYLQIIFKNNQQTIYLPFCNELYMALYDRFHDEFNRSGYIIFGPESDKVNSSRHRYLDENNLWPDY